MITLLSYLSGLLAIVGGIVAFSNTRVGGIILGASALSHWYLLGFGVIEALTEKHPRMEYIRTAIERMPSTLHLDEIPQKISSM